MAAIEFVQETEYEVPVAGGFNSTARIVFESFTSFRTYIPPPEGQLARVVLTNLEGDRISELDAAVVSSFSHALNSPRSWMFDIATVDPKAAPLVTKDWYEAQLWKGRELLCWGPITRRTMNPQKVTCAASDPSWYFSRRNIGEINRTSYVTNGSFEQGEYGWGRGNLVTLGTSLPQFDIITNLTFDGSRAAKLTGSDTVHMEGIGQNFLWEVNEVESPEGDTWYLRYKLLLPLGAEGTPNYFNNISSLQRVSPTETITTDDGYVLPVVIESIDFKMNDDLPRNEWIDVEIPLHVEPGQGAEIIAVQLFAPRNGYHIFDKVVLTRERALAYLYEDQAQIVNDLVMHSQETSLGKTDLNIDAHTPLTGVQRRRIYRFSDRHNIAQSIDDFTSLDRGLDIDMVMTPTSRTLTTYFPYKGTLKEDLALIYGKNIQNVDWSFEGETASNAFVVLGQGSSASREEAAAVDLTTYDGIALEEVVATVQDTPSDWLGPLAEENLAVGVNPEVITATTFPGHHRLISGVQVGDFVPFYYRVGDVIINGTYRIVAVDYIDINAEIAKFTLNYKEI